MTTPARDRVDWRVRVTAGIGVIVGVAMVLLGMEPQLVLVGVIVVVVGATTALVVDLGSVTSPMVLSDHRIGTTSPARADQRVQTLRTRLRSPARRRGTPKRIDNGRPDAVDEIVETLLGVIDDHLLADHGIDRSTDPAAAAEVLGPELTRFTTDSAARLSMTGRRELDRTITTIEEFCTRTYSA